MKANRSAPHIGAAILDVNLHGKAVDPLASQLHASGVPFMFASAYGKPGIPEEFSAYPVMPKPYPLQALVPAGEGLLTMEPDAGHPDSPVPAGSPPRTH